MKVAPEKWTPAERHAESRAKLDATNRARIASGKNPVRHHAGMPVEHSIGKVKKVRSREPRFYQDPTARIWSPSLPQAALCVCGARLDEHSPYPPHVHSKTGCDAFAQDPQWRPPEPAEPRPRYLKTPAVLPKLDAHVLEASNLATQRARLHDALRPYSGTRTRNCRSKRIAPVVQVQRDADRVSVRGLETCASVWACPSCASKILAHRASELDQALERWQGPEPLMLTLTVRHRRTDSLARSRRRMLVAWNLFWNNGRGAQRRKRELDVRYHVRAVEVTWGDNGWHPHIHAFLFCGPDMPREDAPALPTPAPLELAVPTEAPKKKKQRARSWLPAPSIPEKLMRELSHAWRRAVVKAFTPSATAFPGSTPSERLEIGMRYRPSIARGLDLRPYMQAGGYLTKAGLEISLITKTGKRPGHYSPWDIARRAAAGDREAVTLWQGYITAMYGARQLTWSRGARKRFGLTTDETDEQILRAAEEKQEGQVRTLLAQWTGKSWDRNRRRPGWWGNLVRACHSETPLLDLAHLPGAELRGPPGIVEAAAQPELARAGPRAGPEPSTHVA